MFFQINLNSRHRGPQNRRSIATKVAQNIMVAKIILVPFLMGVCDDHLLDGPVLLQASADLAMSDGN